MDNGASSFAKSAEVQQDESLSSADAHTLLEIAAKHRIAADVANVEVHSEVGKGATFRVWLPVQLSDEAVAPVGHPA